ncbi:MULTISPECIES: PepSY-associated TM helix domain-containing protein [unclassified Acidovorax]|uniref:PepSY-associated TM helix domain-containing protein n=1 Tax=unclassified Acidovorax TaxID=2684926 RepID=UPI002882F951|nr:MULTISPECIES: PepSY-associated TM helix domain-containing protein [unclassified Acidovorax]
MKDGFRQSMAWLHTWSGLLVGWVLFMVFASGTSAYFRDEISHWMKPELHGTPAASQTNRAQAAGQAVRFLEREAPTSPRWNIGLPSEREPDVRVTWTRPQPAAGGARQRPLAVQLDPATGERLAAPRATRGGDFFYRLHFDLHYMPAIWARWIIGFCAMFMLVAIISGIVTHRRIFSDFFTFRPKKGQRSWLDAHNATAVLALPFHLMITYTGLVTLMFMYMPWGAQAVYQGDQKTFFAEAFPNAGGSAPQKAAGQPAALTPLGPLVEQAQARWQGAAASRVVVTFPGDANAAITVYRDGKAGLSSNQASMVFSGTTGRVLETRGEDVPAASQTRGVFVGLHIANFAGPVLRWLFFLSGLAGCVMVATGLLLWSVKERQKHAKAIAKGGRIGFGLRLVDGLNVGAIAGLPLAMASFFWANRLIPVNAADRPAAEIAAFFTVWGVAAVAGIAWPARRMWQTQLALGGLLFALVPVLNPLTGGAGFFTAAASGHWNLAGFDATCLLLGAALITSAWWVGRRKPSARTGAASRAPRATPAHTPGANAPQPQGEPGLSPARNALGSAEATPS